MNPGDPGCPTANIGPDRIYVTWSRFTNPAGTPGFITDSKIVMSYSDDRGHSWSAQQVINGSAPFCAFSFAGGTACDDNQFSVPTVSPSTGHLYVAFENFNTEDENQWLVVRSKDGGATFEGPFFVTPDLRCQPAPPGRLHCPRGEPCPPDEQLLPHPDDGCDRG